MKIHLKISPAKCQPCCSGLNGLTHWGRETHICITKLGHHWFRKWLVAWSAPSHYLLIQRLRLIALAVFKSLHGLNPPCLNDMFSPKYVPYQLRDSSLLEQSRCRTTTYGLRSMSYIGAKLWNDLPNDFKATTDFTDFKRMLQTWTGPDLDDPFRSYVWVILIPYTIYEFVCF